MQRVALCFFLLVSFGALAQPAAQSPSATRFDCTPICGNPTCCIAQTQVLPACSITDNSIRSRLEQLARQNKSSEIVDICVGTTKTKNVNPIVDESQAEALRRLSCRWGCCSQQQVVTTLERNPVMATKMFAGTKLAAVGREVTERGALTPENKTKIESEFTPRRVRFCIFCCTF